MQQEKNILFDDYPFPSIQIPEEAKDIKDLDDVFLKLEKIQKNITYNKIIHCETALAKLEEELTTFIDSNR